MGKKKLSESGHSFKDYFKRATNQMVVLGLLSEKPMYAYQMSTEMAKRSHDRYTMALLYPVLYRLQDLGYVEEVKKEISDDNRVRNYYGITETGKAYLNEVLLEFREMVEIVEGLVGNGKGGDSDA